MTDSCRGQASGQEAVGEMKDNFHFCPLREKSGNGFGGGGTEICNSYLDMIGC